MRLGRLVESRYHKQEIQQEKRRKKELLPRQLAWDLWTAEWGSPFLFVNEGQSHLLYGWVHSGSCSLPSFTRDLRPHAHGLKTDLYGFHLQPFLRLLVNPLHSLVQWIHKGTSSISIVYIRLPDGNPSFILFFLPCLCTHTPVKSLLSFLLVVLLVVVEFHELHSRS